MTANNPNIAIEGASYRFKAGNNAKRGGRPRNLPITDRYRQMLEEPLPDAEKKRLGLKGRKTIGDAIAIAMGMKARKGDVLAARELREATEGRVLHRVEVVGSEDEPVHLTVGTIKDRLFGHFLPGQVLEMKPAETAKELPEGESLEKSETQAKDAVNGDAGLLDERNSNHAIPPSSE